MLDDLPHASSAEQRGRLAAALSQLAASARSPVVIISTTSSTQGRGEAGGFGGGRNASGGGAWHGLHKVIAPQDLRMPSFPQALNHNLSTKVRISIAKMPVLTFVRHE